MTAALPEWLRPTAANPLPQQTIRVAFLGRTSTDEQQDPTLSLPRQLTNSERALLPGMVIVAWFYDVESSRKELAQRGSSTAWSKYDIGIQRDGGLNDLIAEATAPDRRFDVVICESIDRIARYTHQGTKIEHDLELAGVPLLAADEPIILDGRTNGRKRKRASQVLLRRTKQGVAEWYIIEMLEKSWDGFETHTGQGWNVGKPPYGYLAEKHKHPVPAKRAQGKHKTKLEIDPVRSPAVIQIYAWRIDEKLSYRAVAERLNADLDRYPPPQPVDPERAVGRWTGSAVREILFNPKYTGHMVWNRRSTKDKLHPGKNNPREEWIVSAEPTHPGIVPIDTYVAAQSIAASRQRSRADARPDTPNRHRQTRRVYALRSYVWCYPCQRRMFGRTVLPYTYYSCQPREREIPDGHPGTISVTEETLLDFTTRFFNTYVLGPDRLQLAVHTVDLTAQQAAEEHRRKIASLRHALTDITNRRTRLLRVLEEADDTDGSMFNDIRERRAQLDQDLGIKTAELAHLEATTPAGSADNVELLADLPEMEIDLGLLPTDRLRRFLDAFTVKITHDFRTNRVRFQATITGRDAGDLSRLTRTITPDRRRPHHALTTGHAAAPAEDGGGGGDLQFCDMPRRGHQFRLFLLAESARRQLVRFSWGRAPDPTPGARPRTPGRLRLRTRLRTSGVRAPPGRHVSYRCATGRPACATASGRKATCAARPPRRRHRHRRRGVGAGATARPPRAHQKPAPATATPRHDANRLLIGCLACAFRSSRGRRFDLGFDTTGVESLQGVVECDVTSRRAGRRSSRPFGKRPPLALVRDAMLSICCIGDAAPGMTADRQDLGPGDLSASD